MIDPRFDVERDCYGAPCQCGGYMDLKHFNRDDPRPDGVSITTCMCCVAEAKCRVCGDTQFVHLPAPEMG